MVIEPEPGPLNHTSLLQLFHDEVDAALRVKKRVDRIADIRENFETLKNVINDHQSPQLHNGTEHASTDTSSEVL